MSIQVVKDGWRELSTSEGPPQKEDNPKASTEFNLEEARQKIESFFTQYEGNIGRANENIAFVTNKQWEDEEFLEREAAGKENFTFNILYKHITSIINEVRNANLELIVTAAPRSQEKEVNDELVENIEDHLRSVFYQNNIQAYKSEALRYSLMGGYAVMEIDFDYLPDSFVQQPYLVFPQNNYTYYFDPFAKNPHKDDGEFAGKVEYMSREEAEKRWPDASLTDFPSVNLTQNVFAWGTEETIAIAHHYCKEYFTYDLVQLDNGVVLREDELDEYYENYIPLDNDIAMQFNDGIYEEAFELPEIVKRRTVNDHKIICRYLTGNEVLEEYEFPGKMLPIIYMDGDTTRINNEPITRGFIEYAKDAQRVFNYMNNEVITHVKNSRKEQYVISEDQLSDYQRQWFHNTDSPVLVYKSEPGAPPPQKQPPSTYPPALAQAQQQMEMITQEVLGRHDVAEGQRGGTVSGRHTEELNLAGAFSSGTYVNNLESATQHLGVVMLSMMEDLYTDEMTLQARTREGKTNNITINGQNEAMPMSGMAAEFKDLTYTIEIHDGASFRAQKQQHIRSLIELTADNPMLRAAILPEIIGMMEIPGKNQIREYAARIAKMQVPPQVLEGGAPPPQQPSPEFMLEQKKLQIAEMEIASKAQEHRIEAAKVMVDAEKNDIELAKAHVKANAESHKARTSLLEEILRHDSDSISHQIKALEMANPRANER